MGGGSKNMLLVSEAKERYTRVRGSNSVAALKHIRTEVMGKETRGTVAQTSTFNAEVSLMSFLDCKVDFMSCC